MKNEKEYYQQHKTCPACGSAGVSQTYAGFFEPPDTNRAWCRCGWAGIVDDLMPELAAIKMRK